MKELSSVIVKDTNGESKEFIASEALNQGVFVAAFDECKSATVAASVSNKQLVLLVDVVCQELAMMFDRDLGRKAGSTTADEVLAMLAKMKESGDSIGYVESVKDL